MIMMIMIMMMIMMMMMMIDDNDDDDDDDDDDITVEITVDIIGSFWYFLMSLKPRDMKCFDSFVYPYAITTLSMYNI